MKKLGKLALCLLSLFLQQSCKNSDKKESVENFNQLSSSLYKLDETNRFELLKVVKSQLESDTANFINSHILDIYYTLDSANYDLLIESGGYSVQTGELLGGNRKDLGFEIFLRKNTINIVKQKVSLLRKKIYEENIVGGKEIIEDIESALYVVTTNFWNDSSLKNQTVAALKLDLMIMQYKLLLVELKYSERTKQMSK